MAKASKKQDPIRKSVRVDCPIEDAFRFFTEGFPEWWPLAGHSLSGDDAESCAIEPWVGGRIYERARSGEEREWGSVTAWDPPERIEFVWNPGDPGDSRQSVAVEFQVEADGTRVTLIHSGWDALGVATCALAMGSLPRRFSDFVARQMPVAV
jgi:uncharacterized protein YndB with AHSA1/START domain